MTIQLIALLAGLFVVPGALLIVGHRLRKRSPRVQAAFWGAILAHIAAAIAATVFSMIPPETWRAEDFWRGAFALWALLVAPVIGGAIGALVGGATQSTRSPN